MTKRSSRFRLKLTKAVALVALLVARAAPQGVLAAEYTVTDLGALGGGESYVTGSNESGQVVGVQLTPDGPQHAFLYSGGTMTNLGTLGGPNSYASAINAAGQVVGASDTAGQGTHAFLYSGGTMTDLGTLGGPNSYASAINAAGQVVGASDTAGQGTHAFLYSGGTMTDLGTLGGPNSYAFGINTAGQVVGASDTAGQGTHAFLYSGGTMTDLGTLGGPNSYAFGINTAGQVVGASDTAGQGTHAFLYSGGTMTDLNDVVPVSYALGINAAGQIVGASDTVGQGTHAFLYSGGTMTDLNDVVPAGVPVSYALGINAAGQIVGVGRIGDDANNRTLLLTPTLLNRFAYALVDVSTTGSDTPDSRYAYNASGGAIHITRQGVGLYDVAFDELPAWGPGLSSAVAVTTYGSSPITCAVVGFDSASPSRTVARVGCFDVVTQRLADSPFTIMVVGNQSLPLQSAFVMSGGPAPVPVPDPAGSWTSARNPITVTHNGAPGHYDVRLGTGNTPISAKLVTGTTGIGIRCNHARDLTGGLQVQCYDRTGAPTDQGFSLVQVAGGRPGRRLGFARVLGPSYPPSLSFNSAGGAITKTRASVGHDAMHFAGLQQLPGRTEHVQVTSRGLLATCNVVRWDSTADGLTVFVECRDGAGEFIDSAYAVLVIE